jgi:nucleoside-diphosphate-sugar epimerase
VDLTDPDAAAELVAGVSPTTIFHLAGGHRPSSEELHTTNVETAVNVMNGAASIPLPPRFVLLGSSAEYGAPAGGLVSESSPTVPVTEYGRVKLEATVKARGIAAASGVPLCVVRPFNIVSAELPVASALGNMRSQLLSGKGGRRIVRCGRVDVVRDFVPIGVVVNALVRMLELDAWPAVLNICSGVPIVLGDLLEAMARVIEVEVVVVSDPGLAEIPSAVRLVGDPVCLRELGIVCQPTAPALAQLVMRGT